MRKLIRNRARCKRCGDIIESFSRKDIKTCRCGSLKVAGGLEAIRRCHDSGIDYEELSEYYEYDWGEGIVSNDGHIWFMGVDLLKCSRTAMDETVTLPIFLPYMKSPELLECSIYSVDANCIASDSPVKCLYIALHEFKHSTILFRDEETFMPLFRHIKDGILESEQTG